MKKLLALLFLPTFSLAAYQPINGSTVVIQGQNSSVQIINSTIGVTGTVAATQSGSWNLNNSTVGVLGTFSDNGAASGTNRETTLPGIYQKAFLNGTAATQGRNAALSVGLDGNLFVTNLPSISTASYSASTNTFTIFNSTQDATGLCGNSKSMVWVYGLRVSCIQTTAGNVSLSVIKRSTAYSGVWSTMTAVPQDSNYAVVNSSAIFSTAAGLTNGTSVGHLDNYQLGCMASATAAPNDIYMSPSNWRMKPIILRGTGDCVGVNFENSSMSGAKISTGWEWMETGTISP